MFGVRCFPLMKDVFFIVGPTATGKSELAADAAHKIGAEVVNADAFQIYEGFPILSAKPDTATLATVPHHLIGSMSILQEMNAEIFRQMATAAIAEIHGRGKAAIVSGGSGLYIKALTHGLTSDWKKSETQPAGVLIFRDREELYQRINHRVEQMFAMGAIDEVRNSGVMSSTAEKMIGIRPIRAHLEGKISLEKCIVTIQQQTRQYAKRQLTWFRNQTNFEPLNISLFSHNEAVRWISHRAQGSLAAQG